MRVRVRFFAGLRERVGRAELELSLPDGLTVAQIWTRALDEEVFPNNVLAAVNMEYADPSIAVADGDEVAFFPPVTGGGQ